jgi:branched-chain amino acid transport system permease protein
VSASVLMQGVVNGLMSGWIYILVALGLNLLMSIMGIVQLAHGEIYMIGAYIAYFICVWAGLNFFLAIFISTLLMGGLGIILERVLFRPFRGQVEAALVISMGLILLLQTPIVVTYGSSAFSIPSPFHGVLTISGIRISWDRVMVIFLSIALTAAFFFFIQGTKIGRAMVAASQDREVATLMGISVDYVSAIAMFLGSAMAAAAGALVGSIFSLTPFMGSFAIMKGIAVIILGGMGSISGAIIGGLILGFVDGFVPIFLSTQIANIIGLILIILILLIRPQGLLGHE